MKIKLHKRFRAVLSLLVTLMLLVGVMPSQVWQGTKADATVVCKIYFDKDHKLYTPGNTEAWHDSNHYKFDSVYVYYVVSGNSYKDIMSWDNTKKCQYYEFTSMPSEMRFYSVENDKDKDAAWKVATNVISGTDIENDMVYYTNGSYQEWSPSDKATSHTQRKLYTVLTDSSDFNATKDMNVILDSAGEPAFSKDPKRHYVSATLYDYFSDYEIKNGTTRTGKNGSTTVDSGITTAYTWRDPERRMQHITFDKALSNDAYNNNSYQHPLYFGDIHHESDESYNFANFNNMPSWGLVYNSHYMKLYHDNNSLRRYVQPVNGVYEIDETEKAIPNAATTGLYVNNINSSVAYNASASNTTNAKRLALTGGASAKWFDSDWLETNNSTGHMIGASYNVDFPFWTKTARRKINDVQWAECNYFYIDSENADHALRLHKEYRTNKYYLKETKQGIYNFTGNDAKIFEAIQNNTAIPALNTTYGFFPFNSKSDFYDSSINNYDNLERADLKNLMDYQLRYDRTNYGFGTYMVIPFELNDNGTLYGTTDNNVDTPITFTFSGDDDLLVYVDGQLVLDIGGNHGKVEGEINFNLQKSWVSRVKSTEHNKNDGGATYGDNGEANAGDKYGYFTQNATLSRDLKTFSVVKSSGDGVRDISSVCGAGPHTMEIFYVERGDFDSNMEIMYNLPVVDNRSFTVEQTITTSVNEIFTATNQSNSANNTAATNFNANVNNMKFEMDLQFSKPTDLNDFNTLLHSQGYYVGEGDASHSYQIKNGNDAYGTATTFTEKDTNSDSTNDTYTVKMGNTQMIKYQSGFVKPYSYNLKVSQGHLFIGNTDKGENTLFTTTWTLNKYGDTDNDENTGQGSDSGPVHTTTTNNTGTGSRPKRGTKTTSTSATNNTTGFDFRGTLDKPDAIAFYNTMQTAELTVTKTFNRKSGDTEAHTFEFTVTFDNVGGINLEEPGGVQATPNNVITTTVSVSYAANESGEKTTVAITGIPVNTKYTVAENSANPTGYMTTYSPSGIDNSTPGTVVSGNNNVGVSNSPSGDPEKIILKLIVELGSTNTLENASDLPAVKLSVRRRTYGSSNAFAELTTVTVPKASDLSQNAQRTFAYSLNYPVSGTDTDYKDKVNASTAYEYQILAYGSDGATLITTTNTKYGDTNGFIVNYNAGGVPAYTRNGTEAVDDTTDNYSDRVLEMGVKLTLPEQQQDTPETGGNGIYILTIGGFIAILLAGAGYFIYKKRLLV